MRQLHVLVRAEKARRVIELGAEHQAFSPAALRAEREEEGDWRMVLLNLPNDRVGDFVRAVAEAADDAQVVLFPQGSLPVQLPLEEVHPRVRSVAHKSTLELVLASLQSMGSWKGLLLYAAFSGIVAAYGLLVNASYMLVAAMLIAPMGAPLMVATIGTSVGELNMARRGALRFAVSVLVLVASAAVLGWAYRLQVSTVLMEQVTSLSAWTSLIALVAGAAGAQSQVQSERASLVTATATGFLVAAALSPTSATLGLAIPLQRWDYVGLMAFQLALQFTALVTGGWLSLLVFGVRPGDVSAGRGSRTVRTALAAALVAATVGLTVWQVRHPPRFLKADVARDAARLTRDVVRSVPGARMVQAQAQFTRADLDAAPGEGLLVTLVVEQASPAAERSAVESAVRTAVRAKLAGELPGVTPYVDVTVLPAP
ncbi:MAG TPA: DUF389 domain-containing protein [Longimicrobiaceae bacterium]|nr:DUF389 domain-containing protein [Longimicrobiaceae bacterium]